MTEMVAAFAALAVCAVFTVIVIGVLVSVFRWWK